MPLGLHYINPYLVKGRCGRIAKTIMGPQKTVNLRGGSLRSIGYVLATTTFVLSIAFPLIFQFSSMYAAPTAAYAVEIARTGNLVPPLLANDYWRGNIRFEDDFPVPSLLLSTLVQVTGIPVNYAMFLALSALAQVAFFALARRIICGERDIGGRGVLLAALAYAYVASTRITVSYVGRGTLGVTLLMQFMLAYVLFLRSQSEKGGTPRSWLAVLMLLTLAIGYTYYFSLLGIFIATGLTFLLVGTLALTSKRPVFRPPVLPVALLSFSLLIYGPFINTVSSMVGAFTLPSFVNNVLLYLKILLRIEAPQDILLQRGLIELDPLTTVTGYWFLNAVKVLSVLAVIYGLVAYRPHNGHQPRLIWLFCLTVLFLSFAELGYLFVTVAAPLRFISIYGSIILLFIVGQFAPGLKADLPANRWRGKLRFTTRASVTYILLVILILASYGSLRSDWYYGVAKPHAYDTVQSLGDFLLSHSTANSPALLGGDAIYAGNLFFITSTRSAYARLIPEPLETDTFVLYTALRTGDNRDLVARMNERHLFLLLMVNDARPVWGDEWGYGFLLPNSVGLNMTLLYNDGTAKLYLVS
jgi:hypothetical protein